MKISKLTYIDCSICSLWQGKVKNKINTYRKWTEILINRKQLTIPCSVYHREVSNLHVCGSKFKKRKTKIEWAAAIVLESNSVQADSIGLWRIFLYWPAADISSGLQPKLKDSKKMFQLTSIWTKKYTEKARSVKKMVFFPCQLIIESLRVSYKMCIIL